MACLIKPPTAKSKGVVSFTTQEELFLRANPNTKFVYVQLKKKYLTLLHHNWHKIDYSPDQMFDLHMAGEEDLKIVNGQKINQIFVDACNFVRPEYAPKSGEKMWDVFFVGNPVFFKDPKAFLSAIREIYDRGYKVRVLYICPMPKYRFQDRHTVVYDIREIYEKMFSQEEQSLFNMVNLYHNYPRFFDRETLAHFYKSSKVFVHTAPDERRCRVAGYAWATGNPVVGKECVGSLLPKNLRRPPYFYLVDDKKSYADQIIAALNEYKILGEDELESRKEFSSMYTVPKLGELLTHFFTSQGLIYEGKILGENLDHRLGRHHGFGISTNTVNQSLDHFMEKLMHLSEKDNDNLFNQQWPEELLFDRSSLVEDLNLIPFSYKFNKILEDFIKRPLTRVRSRLVRFLRG
jgi:glycosyltransferase involved in cell wall biosynthesis